MNQILHSSEKLLARIPLLLARPGRQSKSVVLKVNQQTLAEIVGTTRSRVSFFMNGFRKRGFIHYKGSVRVHRRPFTFALREYVKCELPHEFTQDLSAAQDRMDFFAVVTGCEHYCSDLMNPDLLTSRRPAAPNGYSDLSAVYRQQKTRDSAQRSQK